MGRREPAPVGVATPKYMIGVAAELVGMHPQTLRMYEARGLIEPRRTAGGTRLYSDADLERLRRVNGLTAEFGLSLAGVEYVIRLEDRIAELEGRERDLEAALDEASHVAQREISDVHRSYRREVVVWSSPNVPAARRNA
jgi:MerR family transcriptional regulator/heat shock protein HspR